MTDTTTPPPCTRCRYVTTCNQPPECHALKYYLQTGRSLVPPRIYPGAKREPDEQPEVELSELFEPVPETPKRASSQKGITRGQLEELAAFQSEMQQARKDET